MLHIRPLLCFLLLIGARTTGAQSPPSNARSPQEALRALQERPPAQLAPGTLRSIEHMLSTADRIEERYEEQADQWRQRAQRYIAEIRAGRDPYLEAKGKIVNRAYRSDISDALQGYAVYIPPDYDPSRRYPVYVALHGGSSNGNLFLGVVLGNNMDWLRYTEFLYDEFTPRWTPDWIVVAPTGFGQIMWRWMGEQDVLDVIDDVRAHYSVDDDRVILGGLSNGGVGAYTIGMRHAWRFAAVQAMAGAPSWVQYLGGNGRLRGAERTEVRRYSGMHLAENSINTDFHYFHGRSDTGPMRPNYINEFTTHIRTLDIPVNEHWFDAGHDILYRVHRHGRVYGRLDTRRNRSPQEVRVVTGDYRANRQHWITVTRIARFPELARVKAIATDTRIVIETRNTSALSVDLRDAPVGDSLSIVVDGEEVFQGSKATLGHILHLRHQESWETGFAPDDGQRKRPGLSGPITDSYYGRTIHVYGTGVAEDRDGLRETAERAARGLPLWAWHVDQPVIADTALSDEQMHDATVVLYGTPQQNSVLRRIAGALPIQIEPEAVVVGDHRHTGAVGVKFIYPNPLAPNQYVVVVSGTSTSLIRKNHQLPEFLADYAIYNDRGVRTRNKRVQGRDRLLAQGYFDARWQLPTAQTDGENRTAQSQGADDQLLDAGGR